MYPKARSEDLLVRNLADEVLILDQKTERAHSLNQIAGLVWKHCDGETSVEEIAQLIESLHGIAANEASIELAIDELIQHDLLEDSIIEASPDSRADRREVLKMLAVAMAIPVVMSIKVPKAMAALSPTTTTSTTSTTPAPTTTTTTTLV